MSKKRITLLFILIPFFATSVVYFFLVAYPALSGNTRIVVWADSMTYLSLAKSVGDLRNLLILSANYIGPVLIFKLARYNAVVIFATNWVILLVSLFIIFKNKELNRLKMLIFLFLNPLLIMSLNSVNKEILSLLAASLFIYYNEHPKSKVVLIVLLIVSFATRWNLTFVIIATIGYVKIFQNEKYRKTGLLIIVLCLSLLYPIIFSKWFYFAGEIPEQTTKGFGVLKYLNEIQNDYGYIFVFPVKALFNLVGNLGRITNVFSYSDSGIIDHYSIALFIHQVMFMVVLLLCIKKRVFNKSNVLLMFFWIYLILFGISGAIQYRYYFILYYVLAYILSVGPKAIQNNSTSKVEIKVGNAYEGF